jgi:hypothetical protein
MRKRKNQYAISNRPIEEVDQRITDAVKKAILNAPTKANLCRMLDISFPTLQERLFRHNWTNKEIAVLKEHKIIPVSYYELGRNSEQPMAEGKGTLRPTEELYLHTGPGPKKSRAF